MMLPICLAAIAGCQHGDLAQKRTERRVARLGCTWDAYLESEARRPGNLERDGVGIGRVMKEDSEQLARDVRGADRMLNDDIDRWIARQPNYWHEFLTRMWGKPETIERTAIDLTH